MILKAPWPYFGGKAKVASIVWSALGQPRHYIEPFFGSGAVLLARPNYDPLKHTETICDLDGSIVNAWRSITFNPKETARWCDWPVYHVDLNARRRVIIANQETLKRKLIEDAEYYDAKLAGYWIWAQCCWIGSGLTRPDAIHHLTDAGVGVHSQIPHIANAGVGVHSQIPHLTKAGVGVQIPFLAGTGKGVENSRSVLNWLQELSVRLRKVREVCGDWKRVCGGNWQDKIGECGMFFDPPYSEDAGRDNTLYAEESKSVAHEVREWCIERGSKKSYRIVIAGYDVEHAELETKYGWSSLSWSTNGGYANTAQNGKKGTKAQENRHRETLWFSPHCLHTRKQTSLLDACGLTEEK